MKKVFFVTALLLGALSSTAYARSGTSYGPAYSEEESTAYACTYDDGGKVNLRTGAGLNYKIRASIENGTDVRIISERKGRDGFVWFQVSYGRVIGWARSDYICTA